MKKVTGLLLVTLMILMSFATFASAATVDDIIEKLEESNVREVYVTQAESYLNSITVTPEQAEQIIAYIENVNAIVGDRMKIEDLTIEERKAILEYFAAAGLVLNLTVVADADGNIEITDESAQVVFSVDNANVVRQTGRDYIFFIAGLGLLAMAAASIFVSRKVLNNRA